MKLFRTLRLTLAALVFSAPATAQSSDDWRSWPTAGRLSVGAGYFLPSLDTELQVTDSSGVVGSTISFEKNLGLNDRKGTGLLYVDWRFARRHSLQYRFFDLKRSATTSSSVSISIGEEAFDLDLPIQSFFDITAHELAYSYSVLFDGKKNLYIGAGLSVQNLALGIQGTESSPNPGQIINSTLDSVAPLPTINAGFTYALSDKWLFQTRLGWLAVQFDTVADEKLSGHVVNANAGLTWRALEHVGIFAHYQLFDLDVDYDVGGARFAVDYAYRGPVLGVTVSF